MDDAFQKWAGTKVLLDDRERLIAASAWNGAIAAAATYIDRRGMEGTANALADDLVTETVPGGRNAP